MKKLYMLGVFKNKGVSGDDADTLEHYMELGWEIFTTGFWSKIHLGSDDWICTTNDRLFMYRHITKNLIPWESVRLEDYDEIINLHDRKEELHELYNLCEWSKDMQDAISKNDIQKTNELDYVCVQVRNRDHAHWRSGGAKFWHLVIEFLSQKHRKVYVAGKGNENTQFAKNVECVDLERYCSLVSSDGCNMSIGPSSGLMALNYIYGRRQLPVHILYAEDYNKHVNNMILYFGEKTNVVGVQSNIHLNHVSLLDTLQEKYS